MWIYICFTFNFTRTTSLRVLSLPEVLLYCNYTFGHECCVCVKWNSTRLYTISEWVILCLETQTQIHTYEHSNGSTSSYWQNCTTCGSLLLPIPLVRMPMSPMAFGNFKLVKCMQRDFAPRVCPHGGIPANYIHDVCLDQHLNIVCLFVAVFVCLFA